ncbi:copper chaperone PCu(A)C [Achromobacter deleyi]|uniref:copper chaperone PCu(A)C n=1 Tax=Achromobacter deleyi TaxID=1353891 RepID=UPI001491CA36|nr:copper chaperone PCu(A)C [Achromobacter deleyi]QVQ26549.1 copper chaperone PCu(A)C [Achromobacter deleyi]UIP22122.1 copper chaperone PCu(A)C [Achromobacter deleyi]
MKKISFKPLAAVFTFCALAGFSHAALAQDATLSVEDAWVRATVPSQHATGAFMRLTSAAPGRLVAVESQAAKHVEVHEMAMQDNVMKMRQVPGIDLPAGQAVELKPGGYHVMLIDLAKQITPGDRVQLTLVVEDGAGKQRRVPVEAVARPLNATAAPAPGHGH